MLCAKTSFVCWNASTFAMHVPIFFRAFAWKFSRKCQKFWEFFIFAQAESTWNISWQSREVSQMLLSLRYDCGPGDEVVGGETWQSTWEPVNAWKRHMQKIRLRQIRERVPRIKSSRLNGVSLFGDIACNDPSYNLCSRLWAAVAAWADFLMQPTLSVISAHFLSCTFPLEIYASTDNAKDIRKRNKTNGDALQPSVGSPTDTFFTFFRFSFFVCAPLRLSINAEMVFVIFMLKCRFLWRLIWVLGQWSLKTIAEAIVRKLSS